MYLLISVYASVFDVRLPRKAPTRMSNSRHNPLADVSRLTQSQPPHAKSRDLIVSTFVESQNAMFLKRRPRKLLVVFYVACMVLQVVKPGRYFGQQMWFLGGEEALEA